ncbi:hypothetical protein [Staphylothermus hellenicus]|uniref:Uncharacterized protein n=1 Tax=Staphylothermus hellenicus (strain DSM 12710 / JCM 10830 / BK20S6-10-b1 / P8) TaxID=591019 RepID=D7D9G9_STAHD|nr:hypothetical protein [Staphylothermus hellenicus]ADI32415.1 hypothetical protein Shell_1323 [Staphylothermus hellenicus DSM 12710]
MKSLLERFDFSRLLDDVVSKAKIILSENIVDRLRNIKREELDRVAEKYSTGFYRLVIKPAGEKQFIFYIYNGLLIGAIYENKEKKHGIEAYNTFESGPEQLLSSIEIYSVPGKVLEEIIGHEKLEELEKAASIKQETSISQQEETTPIQTPSQVSKTEASQDSSATEAVTKPVKPAPKIDLESIRREIYELIERLGFDILDVKLELREDIVYLTIELAPMYQTAMMLLDLESTLSAALSVYIEKTRMYDKIIKSQIKMATETKTKLLVKKEDFIATTILGRIIRALNENGVPITKSMYKISGNNLQLYLEVKKSVYPGIDTKAVLQKVYDEVKDEWNGKIKINVKAGRFSKYKIP